MAFDITDGRFESGQRWVSFGDIGSAAVTLQIAQGTDTTTAKQRARIYQVHFSCATGGTIALYDGSEKGSPFVRLTAGGDVTMGTISQSWNFERDPAELNNDDATCLCISAEGTFNGFVKYAWGV